MTSSGSSKTRALEISEAVGCGERINAPAGLPVLGLELSARTGRLMQKIALSRHNMSEPFRVINREKKRQNKAVAYPAQNQAKCGFLAGFNLPKYIFITDS